MSAGCWCCAPAAARRGPRSTRALRRPSGRRRGLFQNSGLLELAGHLHAGMEQLDCASRRQYNPSDNVPPASRLGGRRFRLIQAGRAKFESERLAIENALAQGIGERFPYVVSFFLRKLRRWHSERHGVPPLFSALNEWGIPGGPHARRWALVHRLRRIKKAPMEPASYSRNDATCSPALGRRRLPEIIDLGPKSRSTTARWVRCPLILCGVENLQ